MRCSATSPSEAYDRAIKAAEADATKRAVATFGTCFGLCLYDKERRGVEGVLHSASVQAKSPNIFSLHSPDAKVLAGSLSAEGFCSGLRQVIEACNRPEDIDALKSLNADELAKLRGLPCLICERAPCHAHHIKFAQRPGLSIKVSDEFVVPLCSVHHDELHRSVTERKWWEGQRFDPLPIAQKLWQERAAMAPQE